jgi:hypothetical protein
MRNIHAWAEAFDRRDDTLDAREDVVPRISSAHWRRFQVDGPGPSRPIQAFYASNIFVSLTFVG